MPDADSRRDQRGRSDVLVAVFAYNEGDKLQKTLQAFPPVPPYDVLVVDDGSSDGSVGDVDPRRYRLIRNPRNLGLGASIRMAFRYALQNGYEIIVIMAGNQKDHPDEVGRLLEPIRGAGIDFVQGSRFLNGGAHENMPWYRVVATRYLHPFLFWCLSGTRVTESTNGFRAMRTSLLRDPRIDWEQAWLNQYELEQYVQFKAVRLGYRRTEVPVTKRYPPRGQAYTKVRPLSGWWSMVRPIIYLAFGWKR